MTDQEKLEKVINGLEWLLDNMIDTLNDFMFSGYDGPVVLANKPIIEDALAMLKAQEPRVMTLEEVRCSHENPMWFESKGTFRGQKGFWVLSKGVSPSYVIRLIPAIGKDDTELSLAAYGKVWRCWTSRPTNEKSKVTPWEPAN